LGTLKDELHKWKKSKRKTKSKSKKKQQPKAPETFSTRDIEELMGVHRQTYKRHHGALRSK
jgi:hypothetical protein